LAARLTLPKLARDQAWALFAFVLIGGFFFRSAILEGRVLYRRDISTVWLPQVESLVRCIAAGSWPFWDPYAGFGRPLLADPRAEVLYPPTWLNLILPPWTYYVLFVTLHLAFSAAGIFGLARRWGASSFAAAGAGAVWIASGPVLSLASMWHHLAGAAWIPWIFLAADGALGTGTLRRALFAGAMLAAQVFAGSPDLTALTLLALAGYCAAVSRAHGVRGLRTAALALVIGLGLSAMQWLPTLRYTLDSSRPGLSYEARTLWSLHPAMLVEVLLPVRFSELPLLPDVRHRLFDSKEPWLHSIYLGSPALALAAAGLCSGRRHAVFLAVLGSSAVLFSFGRHSHFYDALTQLLPPLQMLRFPVKALTLGAFAWSLLAGSGVDALRAGLGRAARAAAFAALGVSLLLLLAGALLFTFGAREWGPALLEASQAAPETTLASAGSRLALAALSTALTLALFAASSAKPALARWAAPALLALAVLHPLAVHDGIHWTAPRELMTRRPAVLSAIQGTRAPRLYVYDYGSVSATRLLAHPELLRAYRVARAPAAWSTAEAVMLGAQLYLMPPTSARWGIPGSYDRDVLGFEPPSLARLNALLRESEDTDTHLRLLRMASVTHVLALVPAAWWKELVPAAELVEVFEQPVRVFRVPDPLPRAYAVAGARIADEAAALAALSNVSFDPEREVILGEGRPRPAGAPPGRAHVAMLRPDRVRIDAELTSDGYVVLTDAYDRGWRATLDGRSVRVLRANVAFRAVAVPAGRHMIEYVYQPPWLLAGLSLSLGTLVLGGVAALRSRVAPASGPPQA
jgi:hypothetical protein